MRSLMLFWRVVLEELSTWCRVSTDLDWKTVKARFEKEGDEFLTIALPTYAKDLETGLRVGKVGPELFRGFRKRGELPVFLGEFMDILFDRDTGLLHDVDEEDLPLFVDAIFAVRQLTLMFGKINKPCTPAREQRAIDSYIACEEELVQFENSVVANIENGDHSWNDHLASFRHISSWLFRDVFTRLDGDVYYSSVGRSHEHYSPLVPKHGPGITADRLLGNEKYDQVEWTRRLEEGGFPFGEYAIPNWRYNYLLDRVRFLEPGEERPVKVVLVPKTQKTPRVIAVEPTCMQYAQQAIAAALVEYLEDPSSGLRDMIGFTDQSPNQALAMWGSRDGDLATLDLSEASDRVSNLLVKEMFERWPNLSEAIQSSRSTTADVLGRRITLTKFASMGSALCFPVEAMVFLTIVFHGICTATGRPMGAKLMDEFAPRVRVYGDDIIVPVEFATSVVSSLELFGFKVNDHKSFWTGRFRESCGGEYYAGEDVTVTRVRREFPKQRADVSEVISTVALRNQFYAKGLWMTAKYLDEMVGEVLPHFPTVFEESSVVGRHTILWCEIQRMSEALQVPLVKGYVVDSLIPKSPISGEGALLKCLGKRGLQPFDDPRHLERQGRPDAVRLKLRWREPY